MFCLLCLLKIRITLYYESTISQSLALFYFSILFSYFYSINFAPLENRRISHDALLQPSHSFAVINIRLLHYYSTYKR